jgi:hypothetical protein
LMDLGSPLNYLETFPPSTAKYLMLIHLHVTESCEAFRPPQGCASGSLGNNIIN